MKHTIIVLFVAVFAMMSLEANAQLVYQPFVPSQSSSGYSSGGYSSGSYSSQSSLSTERVRTSAYFLYSDGSIGKVRLEVEISGGSGRVIGYYEPPQALVYNATGCWKQLYPYASVHKCYSTYSANPLEREFMYKANIRGVMYYFDL